MNIINIEKMYPEPELKINMIHDGKNFIIAKKYDKKISAWRQGAKIASFKINDYHHDYSLELQNNNTIIGNYIARFTNGSLSLHPAGNIYIVGEKSLMSCKNTIETVDYSEFKKENNKVFIQPHQCNDYKFIDDRYTIATRKYFHSMQKVMFKEIFGFDMQANQIMFIKNGNYKIFEIPGVFNLQHPCVSQDKLTLGVIGQDSTKMKLIIIDLE